MAVLRALGGALRMDEFDEFPEAEVASATADRIAVTYSPVWSTELLGSFRYGVSGVSGTLTAINQTSEDGSPLFSLTGFSADAATIFGLIDDGKYDLAQQVVLAGDDQVFGSRRGDVLFGYDGDDAIAGGNGRDSLTGGLGADTLTGGAGADTFVLLSTFDSGPGRRARDVVTDFSRADGDTIDLWQVDARSGNEDNDAFTAIVDRFTGAGAELRITASGDGFVVSGDVDGDRRADFSLFVVSATPLVADDFRL